eukprot:766980-Hanusia_phi.AAC.6
MKAGNPMLRVSQLAGAGGARGWGWRGEKRPRRIKDRRAATDSLPCDHDLVGGEHDETCSRHERRDSAREVGFPIACSYNGLKVCWSRLKRADVFCFDVDSTLITSESIVELAKCKGVQDQVAQLTRSAMNGELSFHEALARRMALMRPTRRDVADMTAGDSIKLTPNVKRLFEALRARCPTILPPLPHNRGRKKSIFLLTGGFWELIDPLARELGLSREQVYCNSLLFDEAGSYLGSDVERRMRRRVERGEESRKGRGEERRGEERRGEERRGEERRGEERRGEERRRMT